MESKYFLFSLTVSCLLFFLSANFTCKKRQANSGRQSSPGDPEEVTHSKNTHAAKHTHTHTLMSTSRFSVLSTAYRTPVRTKTSSPRLPTVFKVEGSCDSRPPRAGAERGNRKKSTIVS